MLIIQQSSFTKGRCQNKLDRELWASLFPDDSECSRPGASLCLFLMWWTQKQTKGINDFKCWNFPGISWVKVVCVTQHSAPSVSDGPDQDGWIILLKNNFYLQQYLTNTISHFPDLISSSWQPGWAIQYKFILIWYQVIPGPQYSYQYWYFFNV